MSVDGTIYIDFVTEGRYVHHSKSENNEHKTLSTQTTGKYLHEVYINKLASTNAGKL